MVLGAGALGTILAAHLARAGHAVSLVARGGRAAALRTRGLRIRGLTDIDIRVPVIDDPVAVRPADVLIVTVKTYDTAAAIEPLARDGFRHVFSVANGVLKNTQLAEHFGVEHVLGCMADTSGELLDNGDTAFTRNVCLHLGATAAGDARAAQAIAEMLDACGINAAATAQIESVEWSKFVGWTALLALSVTTRTTTARFLAEPHCAALAAAMIREMAAIAAAEGIAIRDQSPLPVASIASGDARAARDRVTSIGEKWLVEAPTHRMSALQDLDRGRRLEVEETLGYAVSLARRHGLPTPALDAAYSLVAGIDGLLAAARAAVPNPSPPAAQRRDT